MVNEIIKEQMIRTLIEEINTIFDSCRSDYKIFNDLYITNELNENRCIHEKYEDLQNGFEDNVYSKLAELFHAIRNQINIQPYIHAKFDIDYEHDITVTLIHNNIIVYQESNDSWHWTWNSVEELQEYMFDVYSEIKSNIENQLTLDELYILHNYASKQNLCPCKFSDDCIEGIIHCGDIENKLAHMITKMEAVWHTAKDSIK